MVNLSGKNQLELHLKWFEYSAQQGNAYALLNLACCHKNGSNATKKIDLIKATDYLKQSVALGNAYAHYSLYMMLDDKDYEQIEYHASAMIKSSTHQMAGFDIIHDLYRRYCNEKNISKAFQLFRDYNQVLKDNEDDLSDLILSQFLEDCDTFYIDAYFLY